ncbi:MAG: TlpA family protein disulfide reductase [Mycobacteriaceae bacterium]|nr:TlpA family protein disulfide reductase [Mycobacteriaceae bacterium]
MRSSTRWTIAILIVVAVIVAALARELRSIPPSSTSAGRSTATPDQPGPDLAALRRRADLSPCPPDGPGPGPQALQGATGVQCLADGAPVDPAKVVGGRAVVLNLWAYWCAPCAQELPAMAEYQRRVGTAVTVITVHQDDDAAAALSRLADWGVRLPTWQDGGRRIAAALKAPNIMPTSVVLRADGSVAGILPRAFDSADDIAAAVDQTMGASG